VVTTTALVPVAKSTVIVDDRSIPEIQKKNFFSGFAFLALAGVAPRRLLLVALYLSRFPQHCLEQRRTDAEEIDIDTKFQAASSNFSSMKAICEGGANHCHHGHTRS